MSRVLLLFGGESAERDVSRATARACAAAVSRLGHELLLLDPLQPEHLVSPEELASSATPSNHSPGIDPFPAARLQPLIAALSSHQPDLIFNCLHGGMGEDGHLASLCELLAIPLSSSPSLAAALAMDKHRSKLWMQQIGVPTPAWLLLEDAILPPLEFLPPGPWVVKPNSLGSSVGITIVKDSADLPAAARAAADTGDSVLLEQFIEGRELTVAWMQGRDFPVVEIVPRDGWYDYSRKYSGGTDYHCPAVIPAELVTKLNRMTARLNESMGCRGVTRSDFRLDAEGGAWCLEVNTTPGMTDKSLVPKAAAAMGWSFDDLVAAIVAASLSGE